ncbi:MAG: flagellar filament capping protein FliD [Myxococcaceae bacterium]|jgi:flagellar hook-associated protein 2|nr:flagellar filament capping protein FliD [Myxococcaceae bacterium]
MTTTPAFRASGLASGLDTTNIVNELVKIESRTIDLARRQQDAFKSQLSALGDVISKLSSLRSAASGLGTSGVLAVRASGTNSGFTASPTSSAATGRYSIQVDMLAQAARARSQAFTGNASAPVRGGTLDLSIDGTTTSVTLDDGMTLAQAAERINRSGAAVSATVLETNGQAFLSITRRDTGFVVGQPASSALQITETSTGSLGQALGATVIQSAVNAQLTVDGLPFERRSNVVADVVPGTTLSLTRQTTTPEDLVLATNTSETQTALKRFVDAYNDVMKLVRNNLAIGEQTDRTRTLGGDPSLRGLQSALQGLVVGQANPGSPVRTLADIGVRTQNDGTLSIDASRLEKAIATDAGAVNALFQTATTGIAAATTSLVERYTSGSSSILELRKSGIDRSIRTMDSRIESLQLRVDAYRERLVRQFTAMERVVGQFKSIGDFLTSREKQGTQE